MQKLSKKSYLLFIPFLALLSILAFHSTSFANTMDASTQPNIVLQEPIPSGQETMWVNVTRWVKGKAFAPTESTLRSIINSYRSGGWRTSGSMTQDSAKQWWQKLVRTKYVPPSGAGVVLTWHWENGCPVDNYSHRPGLGGSSQICDCWNVFADYYRSQGIGKPSKCK